MHYRSEFSGEWQYGYKDSIQYVKQVANSYQNIYVTSNLGRPYIYYLVYLQTDPTTFRKTAKIHRDSFGFVTVEGFLNYHFFGDVLPVHPGKNLYIGLPNRQPNHAKILKTFYLLNGQPVLEAYTI